MTAKAQQRSLAALHVACGAGGTSLGFERAGICTAYAFDVNPAVVNTHVRNMPWCPAEVRDLYTVAAQDLPAADVLCCGIPCEAYSTAGYQRGLEDERDISPVVAGLIRDLRKAGKAPRYIFLENVPPYMKSPAAEMIRQALDGYRIAEAIFAHADYGVCQKRERWHLLAALDGPAPMPLPTHSQQPGFTTQPWVTFGQIREQHPADPHYVTAKAWRGIIRRQTVNEIRAIEREGSTNTSFAKCYIVDDDDLMPTVLASWWGGYHRNQATIVFDDYRFRAPTLLEVRRAQGFPDDFEFCGNVRQQYEQIARAVPPPFAYAVARAILAADQESIGGDA